MFNPEHDPIMLMAIFSKVERSREQPTLWKLLTFVFTILTPKSMLFYHFV